MSFLVSFQNVIFFSSNGHTEACRGLRKPSGPDWSTALVRVGGLGVPKSVGFVTNEFGYPWGFQEHPHVLKVCL